MHVYNDSKFYLKLESWKFGNPDWNPAISGLLSLTSIEFQKFQLFFKLIITLWVYLIYLYVVISGGNCNTVSGNLFHEAASPNYKHFF